MSIDNKLQNRVLRLYLFCPGARCYSNFLILGIVVVDFKSIFAFIEIQHV